jgi:ABC-type multidrug transport system fused ATPase/permease subunit
MGAEDETPAPSDNAAAKQLHSAHSSGMEASVLRFKDVNFTVGSGDKEKTILQDINAKVKWGQVLARK